MCTNLGEQLVWKAKESGDWRMHGNSQEWCLEESKRSHSRPLRC